MVLVQNPSLVCTLLLALLRPLFCYRLIVDAHGDAVIPYAHNNALVRAVSSWLLRKAELTIVTNSALAARVRAHKGTPFVLFDNLPHVPATPVPAPGAGKQVLFISTYATDEPHAELFEAASTLPDVTFYVTGKIKLDRLAAIPAPPPNVKLTGFLTEQAYWDRLLAANVVVDLTTMPDCLVCGAYEAVAAGRALVLSDNAPSRELFGQAALYTSNTAQDIALKLTEALATQKSLEEKALSRAVWLQETWDIRAQNLLELIGRTKCGVPRKNATGVDWRRK